MQEAKNEFTMNHHKNIFRVSSCEVESALVVAGSVEEDEQ